MRSTAPAALLVLALTTALRCEQARGADDVVAKDVDAVLELLRSGDAYVPRGPSPTSRLARLLGAKKRPFTKELEERWEPIHTQGGSNAPLEHLIRFVHGRSGVAPILRVENGAVVVQAIRQRRGKRAPETPTFRELTDGEKPIAPPKPDALTLLSRLDEGLATGWTPLERTTFAMALGESSRGSAAATKKLVEIAARRPRDGAAIVALAWSHAGGAGDALSTRARDLAARVAEGHEDSASLLATACIGLAEVDRVRLEALLAGLRGKPREVALSAAPLAAAMPIVLRLGQSADEDDQRSAATVLHALLVRSGTEPIVPAEHVAPLIRLLAQNLEDTALFGLTTETAEQVLFAGMRHAVKRSVGMRSRCVEQVGERVGPYPDVQSALRSLAADLDRGHIVFLPEGKGVFGKRVQTPGVPSLELPRKRPDSTGPLTLRAKRSGSLLDLTLSNEGKTSYTISPIALRYGTAEWTTYSTRVEKTEGEWRVESEVTNLHIEFGYLGPRTAVRRSALLEMVPGATYSWSILLRPEHAEADEISISLVPVIGVESRPRGLFIDTFGETWVK